MYKKILVPLDGSPLSEAIIPYSVSFSKALKVPVELLLVIVPETVTEFCDPKVRRSFESVATGMKQGGLDFLNKIAQNFSELGDVTCTVEVGDPADIIVDRGAVKKDTLITMATHGRSGAGRWLLGSVADKVLHASSQHLLFVRPGKEGKKDKQLSWTSVVVPLDGSGLAESVLPYAAALAKEMNLEVILVRVYQSWEPLFSLEGQAYIPSVRVEADQSREEAKRYLEDRVEQLRWDGIENASYLLVQGDPASEIIDLARDVQDNLIAICTHGRSGVKRWVLGSVTDRVVCQSGDPVLVVRAQS